MRLFQHGHSDALLLGYPPSFRIAGVCVADHSYTRVSGQDPLQSFVTLLCAISYQAHSGVNAVPDANTTTLMDANPSGSRGSVQERVKDRPVRNGIATVQHSLGLPSGRGNAPRV